MTTAIDQAAEALRPLATIPLPPFGDEIQTQVKLADIRAAIKALARLTDEQARVPPERGSGFVPLDVTHKLRDMAAGIQSLRCACQVAGEITGECLAKRQCQERSPAVPPDRGRLEQASVVYNRAHFASMANAGTAIGPVERHAAHMAGLAATLLSTPADGYRAGAEAMREACLTIMQGNMNWSRKTAAIRALDIPAAGGGWRPIESAPKDGTTIITYTTAGYYKGVHTNVWKDRDGWQYDSAVNLPSLWQPLPHPASRGDDMSDNATLVERLTAIAMTGMAPRYRRAAAEAAARIAELEADNTRLSAALASTRQQVTEQSERADSADALRLGIETGKVHPALRVDVEEHRDDAYKHGWSDGYAEGHGKATVDRASCIAALEAAILAEREALVKIVRDHGDMDPHGNGGALAEQIVTAIRARPALGAERDEAIRAAILAEREACARTIEAVPVYTDTRLAAAIRARPAP